MIEAFALIKKIFPPKKYVIDIADSAGAHLLCAVIVALIKSVKVQTDELLSDIIGMVMSSALVSTAKRKWAYNSRSGTTLPSKFSFYYFSQTHQCVKYSTAIQFDKACENHNL